MVAVLQDDDLPARIDRAVQDVLANPPYLDEPNLLERLVQWVADRLAGAVGEGAAGLLGRVAGAVIVVVVIVVVVALGWLVARRIGAGAFRRVPTPTTTTATGSPERSAAAWLAEARAARDAGRHRDAVRAAYRAVVVHLVELAAVPATAGATVGTHRVALRRGSVVDELQARGFDDASEVFERVWYADRDATSRDADVVLVAADRLGVGS